MAKKEESKVDLQDLAEAVKQTDKKAKAAIEEVRQVSAQNT